MQHIDGQDAEAILTSDRGAEDILAPFYNKIERRLKTRELVKTFGPHVTSLTGNKEDVSITPELVKNLWNFRNEAGLLPAFFLKIPNCYTGFPEMHSEISLPRMDTAPRPRVTGVELHMLYPDGSQVSTTLAGSSFEGIFWSDRAASEILAPFYNTIERRSTRDEMIERCGPAVTSIIGNQKNISITPKLVENLWNLEDENGFLPPFLMKIPDCFPGMVNPLSRIEGISRRKAA
jgi:hypothetical protein